MSRATPDGGPPRQELTTRILGSYAEMPGLILNVPQAARLTCAMLTCFVTRSSHAPHGSSSGKQENVTARSGRNEKAVTFGPSPDAHDHANLVQTHPMDTRDIRDP